MIESRDILTYLAIKCDGDYRSILKEARERPDPSVAEVNYYVSKVKSNVLTILDPDYPEYLRKSSFPPIVLFYYGDISLINEENFRKNIAVIGTRNPTEYGIAATERIVSQIADEYNVVSGMAMGIDGIAQNTAIISGGKTIAVLGSGIDNIYPKDNRDLYFNIIDSGGLVISEYPGFSEPAKEHFPVRNRIIAQISRAVIVTEAYERSGTSNTVSFASMIGRDVLAVPYPCTVTNSFCNLLLYEGAIFIRDGKDVLDYFNRLF